MEVELRDIVTYLATGIEHIFLHMPSGDVLFVPNLKKKLLSVSTITELQCIDESNDQHYSQDHP